MIVEQAVANAREIEVSVLGNDRPVASLPGEIIPGADFYDYDAKYVDDTSELVIPAPLTTEQTAQVRDYAVRAFQAVDGTGIGPRRFLVGRRSRRHVSERTEHDARLHPYQHVSETVGSKRTQLRGPGAPARGPGHGTIRRQATQPHRPAKRKTAFATRIITGLSLQGSQHKDQRQWRRAAIVKRKRPKRNEGSAPSSRSASRAGPRPDLAGQQRRQAQRVPRQASLRIGRSAVRSSRPAARNRPDVAAAPRHVVASRQGRRTCGGRWRP